MKKRIFDIIQIGNKEDIPSTSFDIFITVAILVSILTTLLQTFDELNPIKGALSTLEFITILIFIVEYVLRLWTANYLYPDKKYSLAVASFMLSFFGMIDLLTIVSYFVPFMFTNGAVALRMLRVIRIFRLFMLSSNYDAFNVIFDVLKAKWEQIASSIIIILILMLASSMCMYSLEHEAQPEAFSNAFSGLWWSVSTVLTVGYGDIYPVTIAGKIMAIIIAFMGVGLVAIPTGIISAGFVEYFSMIKNGVYAEYEADFVTVDIHEPKRLKEIEVPKGLYIAVVLRNEDILFPYDELMLMDGDAILLASTSIIKINGHLREVTLKEGHPWIGCTIKKLDISRQVFLVMIKRGKKQFQPKGNTMLKQEDVILVLDKREMPKIH